MRRAVPLLLLACLACEVADDEPASAVDGAPVEDAAQAVDAALDAAPPALVDATDTLRPVDRGPADVAIEDAAPDAAPPAPDAAPDAAPPTPGTWDAPIPVDTFPATLEGDTRDAPPSVADRYTPCAPAIREEGAEIVYAVTPDLDGTLVATLDDLPGDDVDVDLHLLDALDADACVARDNVELRWPVTAGETLWLVVDTWFDGANALPGPYRLELRLLPRDASGCPDDMVAVEAACVDRYEAPNRAGALPLVMYSFVEAEAWCAAREKRLCFDDEWIAACTGPLDTSYPYGDRHQPGVCRDDAVWRAFQPNLLAGWPLGVTTPRVESLDRLLLTAAAQAPAAAEHVEWLYQAHPAGDNAGCTNDLGAYDMVGNVEEWTRRRDGGEPDFHGRLLGRYWAESRTCRGGVTTHGDGFRFYEIGFRCCRDRE